MRNLWNKTVDGYVLDYETRDLNLLVRYLADCVNEANAPRYASSRLLIQVRESHGYTPLQAYSLLTRHPRKDGLL